MYLPPHPWEPVGIRGGSPDSNPDDGCRTGEMGLQVVPPVVVTVTRPGDPSPRRGLPPSVAGSLPLPAPVTSSALLHPCVPGPLSTYGPRPDRLGQPDVHRFLPAARRLQDVPRPVLTGEGTPVGPAVVEEVPLLRDTVGYLGPVTVGHRTRLVPRSYLYFTYEESRTDSTRLYPLVSLKPERPRSTHGPGRREGRTGAPVSVSSCVCGTSGSASRAVGRTGAVVGTLSDSSMGKGGTSVYRS